MANGGTWAPFHEIGHNLQDWRWTPKGTIEVTCNIFSILINNKVIHSMMLGYRIEYAIFSVYNS